MRCIGCGCTEMRACLGGCSWLCLAPPKCSACVEAGILTLLHHNIIRLPPGGERRDAAHLVISATGRRIQCL